MSGLAIPLAAHQSESHPEPAAPAAYGPQIQVWCIIKIFLFPTLLTWSRQGRSEHKIFFFLFSTWYRLILFSLGIIFFPISDPWPWPPPHDGPGLFSTDLGFRLVSFPDFGRNLYLAGMGKQLNAFFPKTHVKNIAGWGVERWLVVVGGAPNMAMLFGVI